MRWMDGRARQVERGYSKFETVFRRKGSDRRRMDVPLFAVNYNLHASLQNLEPSRSNHSGQILLAHWEWNEMVDILHARSKDGNTDSVSDCSNDSSTWKLGYGRSIHEGEMTMTHLRLI